MKKILSFLGMCLTLLSMSSIAKLWAVEELSIFQGDIMKYELRVVASGDGYMIVEIDGKKYYVKVQN